MAALFERAAGDADTIGCFEARPDFLAGYLAGQKLAVKCEQLGDRRAALVKQLDPKARDAASH